MQIKITKNLWAKILGPTPSMGRVSLTSQRLKAGKILFCFFAIGQIIGIVIYASCQEQILSQHYPLGNILGGVFMSWFAFKASQMFDEEKYMQKFCITYGIVFVLIIVRKIFVNINVEKMFPVVLFGLETGLNLWAFLFILQEIHYLNDKIKEMRQR